MSDETPAPETPATPAKPDGGDRKQPSMGKQIVDAIVTGNSVVVTFLAIVLGLVVGGILMVLSDQEVLDKYKYFFADPGDSLSASWTLVKNAYVALFEGSIVDPSTFDSNYAPFILGPISETISQATPLIFGGIAISIAFRAGLFNIGAQGQIIAGAILASWMGFQFDLPVGIHLILVILAGILGGAFYAAIAGVLKGRFGAHEVIITIMLNYIALYFLSWLLTTDAFQRPGTQQLIGKSAHSNATLPRLFGDELRINLGIILALAALVLYWWILNRSAMGFELRAVGSNPEAARTAGMSVPRAQVVAMALSGGMAGLIGVSQVMGPYNPAHSLTTAIDAGLGFTAITVALLGRTSPVGVLFASLLFGALQAGGSRMQASAGVSIDIVIVVQAVIVLMVAAPPLVRTIFRLKGAHSGGEGALVATETGGVGGES
ncbi:ABC transporter permease [Yinghuangia seranimata]|uniref:ABC transporter permease n=1 Tax=Yinghuangia seranimata TaxID=408067 RepID=UPI00248AB2C7|nr:ABC transporter permease [Yinghuangia seranimata]MDI2130948.1 ABC transporter permease [Yinghuangia seranimata]